MVQRLGKGGKIPRQHHDALKCRGLGMAIIDAGHHGTEKVAPDIIKEHIERHVKGTGLGIEVIKSEIDTNPFWVL
jgi:putative NIF3 family GTP cyclohydrolase 1 type 2